MCVVADAIVVADDVAAPIGDVALAGVAAAWVLLLLLLVVTLLWLLLLVHV